MGREGGDLIRADAYVKALKIDRISIVPLIFIFFPSTSSLYQFYLSLLVFFFYFLHLRQTYCKCIFGIRARNACCKITSDQLFGRRGETCFLRSRIVVVDVLSWLLATFFFVRCGPATRLHIINSVVQPWGKKSIFKKIFCCFIKFLFLLF